MASRVESNRGSRPAASEEASSGGKKQRTESQVKFTLDRLKELKKKDPEHYKRWVAIIEKRKLDKNISFDGAGDIFKRFKDFFETEKKALDITKSFLDSLRLPEEIKKKKKKD